ncbi:leucine-rich repeat domain-containing protein [Ascoidea rubescens DSM 1968]|uniref:L domain-like protein n=1 Tax=Ascoidea rubescens DSM 1968 TaxID=1344418 RepID=A0A1D2VR50_9ASCO|nr:L domain-like protein [Ascoidea rubescens DSM 1968]ODV64081.1 L domain-like protein [Ascoidea rubescens DSM 1968]
MSRNRITKINNLSNLTDLKVLNLSQNRISKINKNLSNLINLTDLNLSRNLINNIENLDHLYNLIHLNLSYNDITEIKNLNNLTNLTYLDLKENKIELINNLNGLTNLTHLDLKNNIIERIYHISDLINLKYLDLGDNKIKSIENLDSLNNLTYLNLSENIITCIDNIGRLKLSNLKTLNLSWNNLTVIAERYPLVFNLQLLENLILRHNKISFISLNSLNNLKFIDLSFNDFSKTNFFEQISIKYNSNDNKLIKIRCMVNLFDIIQIRKADTQFNELKYLDLSSNFLKKFEIEEDCLTNLEVLILNDNKLETIEIKSSRKNTLINFFQLIQLNKNNYPLKNLRKLFLCNNLIRDGTWIKNLSSNLEEIDLSLNLLKRIPRFGNSITHGDNKFKKLRKLEMAQCSIKKMENLGDLTNLRVLNLRNNQIGKIEGIENLLKLGHLNLQYNQVSHLRKFNVNKLNSFLFIDLSGNEIEKFSSDNFFDSLDNVFIKCKKLEIIKNHEKYGELVKHLVGVDVNIF